VSIRPAGRRELGTRTELKNLNSFKFVEKAIAYEIQRQKEVLADGGSVAQETRLWDTDGGRTTSMRGKEEAHDYRYFPDPDLLPLVVDDDWVARISAELPELPDDRRQRFATDYRLAAPDAALLAGDRDLADYFEACLDSGVAPRPAANWITGPLLGLLNAGGKTVAESPVSAADLAGLIALIENGTISGKIAKTVFDDMAATGRSAQRIVADRNLVQVTDASALEPVVQAVVDRHPAEAAAYRGGKTKLLGFFVGQVMKDTRGKANPKLVNDLIRRLLGA
jgi:aspartyl-tRNA(Asn)/glutamyl-tRNA(Gln) amidotransferase subunit B